MSNIFEPQAQSISDDNWGSPLVSPVLDLSANEETPIMPDIKQSPQSLVFENQDILGVIFENFAIDFDSPLFNAHRRDLLNAALVCTACTDPAMNILWGNMDSFIPLIQLLPTTKLVNNRYVVNGTMQADDWVRFDFYACRVRSFLVNRSNPNISTQVFIRLVQLRPSPLLPGLQVLHLPLPIQNSERLGSANDSVTVSLLVSSPSLRSIRISNIGPYSDYILEPVMSTAVHEIISLKCLNLSGGTCSLDSLVYIASFKDLRYLTLQTDTELTSTFLKNIGNLPCLIDLNIKMTHLSEPPSEARSAGKQVAFSGHMFKGVKNLHITGCPTSMVKFFDSMQPSSVEVAVLECENHPNGIDLSGAWTECFTWMSSAINLQSLSVVELGGPNQTINLPMTAIYPIFQLVQLRHLKIDITHFGLTSSGLVQIAQAFPNLVTLILPSDTDNSSPSLSALRVLAIRCPHLEELHILVDIRDALVPIPSFQLHALKKLYLNAIQFQLAEENLIAMALYLHFTFPHVQVAGYGRCNVVDNDYWSGERYVPSDQNKLLWIKVQNLLRAFQTVRHGVLLAHSNPGSHAEELLLLEDEIFRWDGGLGS
ncbi:hypothetical protein BDQ12DRAFT_729720 [Crucibulum laeve]|uniref:F-box domain-containing protein n=1 Tax=Crucibulum laeve TaxID=68775 RepID=A0A5C3LH66_9AGAR|nr:hypothetical protein BDQ12DRAFT_729720 [Crucibulum laeve]